MPKSIKFRVLVSILHKLGYKEVRQKGSHIIFGHLDGHLVVIPKHDEIRGGLLTKIIKEDLGLSKEDFFKLVK